MKYGVIVCPRCGMAKGVEASRKTTTCRCGREIKLRRLKLRFVTESPRELADSVARANAAIRGGEPLPPEKRSKRKDPYYVIAERTRPVKDPVEKMLVIARALTDLKGGFTVDDFGKVLQVLGKGSAESTVQKLRELNLVFESADGKLRAV